jgi:SWIM zinc finger
MTKTKSPQTANCRRCHALLTAPKSVAKGIGVRCEKIEKLEAIIAEFKPATVEKAVQLINDGGIVKLRGQVFQAISSNGTDTYLVAPQACNCPAGLRGKYACYHRVAAMALCV